MHPGSSCRWLGLLLPCLAYGNRAVLFVEPASPEPWHSVPCPGLFMGGQGFDLRIVPMSPAPPLRLKGHGYTPIGALPGYSWEAVASNGEELESVSPRGNLVPPRGAVLAPKFPSLRANTGRRNIIVSVISDPNTSGRAYVQWSREYWRCTFE